MNFWFTYIISKRTENRVEEKKTRMKSSRQDPTWKLRAVKRTFKCNVRDLETWNPLLKGFLCAVCPSYLHLKGPTCESSAGKCCSSSSCCAGRRNCLPSEAEAWPVRGETKVSITHSAAWDGTIHVSYLQNMYNLGPTTGSYKAHILLVISDYQL